MVDVLSEAVFEPPFILVGDFKLHVDGHVRYFELKLRLILLLFNLNL